MFKYTYQDLESLFQYVKEHPDASLLDWIDKNNKQLTEEEKTKFKWIEMATIDVPTKDNKINHLYLINWVGVGGGHFSEPFNIFIRKHFGECYKFWKESYYECALVTPDEDFFNYDNYERNEEIKGLIKLIIKSNNATVTVTNHWEVKDEKDGRIFGDWMDDKRRKENLFWMPGCDWQVFIDDIDKLEFKPVLDFWK